MDVGKWKTMSKLNEKRMDRFFIPCSTEQINTTGEGSMKDQSKMRKICHQDQQLLVLLWEIIYFVNEVQSILTRGHCTAHKYKEGQHGTEGINKQLDAHMSRSIN